MSSIAGPIIAFCFVVGLIVLAARVSKGPKEETIEQPTGIKFPLAIRALREFAWTILVGGLISWLACLYSAYKAAEVGDDLHGNERKMAEAAASAAATALRWYGFELFVGAAVLSMFYFVLMHISRSVFTTAHYTKKIAEKSLGEQQ